MDKVDLIRLVGSAQSRDTQAFDGLVRRFQNPAVLYARSLLHFDRMAAEDAAQEAFVQAWRDLPTLQTPAAFPAWLRRLVFKQCDRIRRRGRLCTVPLDDAFDVAGGPEPFRATQANEDSIQLRTALEALPPREREAALLYYWDDHRLADIAAFLGVPQTTIKNRLHTARLRLRKELWEMAEEILAREKPSRDDAFVESVVTRLVREFQQQMRDDPHTADRRLLREGRAALDAAMAAPGPLDWETVRDGFSLLLDQADHASIPTLMTRYLAQPINDSRQFWACYHLGNEYAVSGDSAGAVLAHEALERLLPDRAAHMHVSDIWPFYPLADSTDGAAEITGENTLRLVSLSRSGEFADAWFAVGRGDEYLAKIDAALIAAVPSRANRPWRFYSLRMAVSRCEMQRKLERARGYITQMYALGDETEDAAESANWRLKAIGHEVWVLRAADENETAFERCREAAALLEQFPDERWSGSERHNLAHTFMFTGHPDMALPLFEKNHARGRGIGWGYLLHAAAVYHTTGDRARTLRLLRDGVVREASDLTEDFQQRPEFADIKDDPEFLAAIRRP